MSGAPPESSYMRPQAGTYPSLYGLEYPGMCVFARACVRVVGVCLLACLRASVRAFILPARVHDSDMPGLSGRGARSAGVVSAPRPFSSCPTLLKSRDLSRFRPDIDPSSGLG